MTPRRSEPRFGVLSPRSLSVLPPPFDALRKADADGDCLIWQCPPLLAGFNRS